MADECATSRSESPPEPFTYSLRTLFFIVTCAAIIFAAIGAIKTERPQIIFGLLFAGTLLSVFAFMVGRRRVGECLIALSFTLLLLGLYAIAGGRRHINHRDTASKNNLKKIGDALMIYATINQELPRASMVSSDKPLCSWRGILLTQIGRPDLMEQLRLNEPWNGPNNSKIANQSISLYHSPSDPSPLTNTSYLAVVGPNTAIGQGSGQPNAKQISLDHIANHGDPSKLIMVIEVPNSGVNWLEPRDISVDQLKQTGLRGLIPPGGLPPYLEGFNVLFADGHVETLPADIDLQKLAEMLEIDPAGGSGK